MRDWQAAMADGIPAEGSGELALEVGESTVAGVKPMRAPHEPTQEEIDEHNVHHCHFRSWCRACVAGRGKSDAHRKLDDQYNKAVAVISCDYCFMGEKDEDELGGASSMPI